MNKIREDIIVLTTWLSFIAAIWLWLFRIIEWDGPVMFLVVVIMVLVSQSKGTNNA